MLQREEGMKRKHRVITQRDVQDAMDKIIGAGGAIVRQPDQVALPCNLVGSSHAIYEAVMQQSLVISSSWWSQPRSTL